MILTKLFFFFFYPLGSVFVWLGNLGFDSLSIGLLRVSEESAWALPSNLPSNRPLCEPMMSEVLFSVLENPNEGCGTALQELTALWV